MDKIEEIQQMWSQLNARLDRLEPSIVSESRRVAESNIISARKRLMRRDKFMIWLCFICACVFPVDFWLTPATEDGIVGLGVGYWRIITVVLFFAYFITCGIIMIKLYLNLQEINIGTMSIEEISKRARHIKQFHLRSEVCNGIFAIIVLSEYFYVISMGNPWLLVGGLVGLVLGLSVALPLFFRYMSDYRRMIYPYDEND